jgi:stage II sporulation protein D
MMLKRIFAMLSLAIIAATSLNAAPLEPGNPFARKTHYRPSDSLPYIKVLLARDVDNPVVEVKGKYRVYNPHDDSLLSQGYIGKKYPLQSLPHGIKWGEEFPDIYQLAIVPDNDQSILFINGNAYRGILYAYDINGKINLVNELPIEEYVKSYLAAHLNQPLEEEAIEAVAIVARTNTYYQRLNSKNPHWQVDAREEGFQGYIKPEYYTGIRQAVVATRYLVMKSKEINDFGGIFPATWTEHCAGKTAEPSTIFRKQTGPGSDGVESPLASLDRENSRWSFTLKKSFLANLARLDKVTNVSLYTDKSSDKVYAVRFQNKSESKDIDFFTLQELIGPEKLKSNDFTISVTDDTIIFTGYGEGHGVGLCLYSAEEMAAKGALAPEIIHKFFPNAEIVMMPTLRFIQPLPSQGYPSSTGWPQTAH